MTKLLDHQPSNSVNILNKSQNFRKKCQNPEKIIIMVPEVKNVEQTYGALLRYSEYSDVFSFSFIRISATNTTK